MAHRDYPEDFVLKALELAAAIGQRPAAEQLEMPYETLHSWTKMPEHAERWSELRRVNAPKWRARAAVPLEDLVDEYAELQAKALKKAGKAVDEMDPKDVGNFLRSIAWAQSSAADQANRLRGHATHVHEHRVAAEQIEAGLKKLLEEAASVDSTAEEIPPPDALPAPDPE